jgi:hypothetical protein
MNIQDVIEILLGGGHTEEINLMFGNDEDEDDQDEGSSDDQEVDDDGYEEIEDSKEDIDSQGPEPYSMEEGEDEEDGYEHKCPLDGGRNRINVREDSDDDAGSGELTSDIRLRGLSGGNASDGPNI